MHSDGEVGGVFLIVQGPGVQLINGISGIFGNLGSVILGIPPNQPGPTRPPPPPAPSGCPVEGCPAEGEEEGLCTSTCNEWPYSQCRVELRRPDGSWQAATCLNPYTARPGPFNPFPQKFTNYPEWVSLWFCKNSYTFEGVARSQKVARDATTNALGETERLDGTNIELTQLLLFCYWIAFHFFLCFQHLNQIVTEFWNFQSCDQTPTPNLLVSTTQEICIEVLYQTAVVIKFTLCGNKPEQHCIITNKS